MLDVLAVFPPPAMAHTSVVALRWLDGRLLMTWCRPSAETDTRVAFLWVIPGHARALLPVTGRPLPLAHAVTFLNRQKEAGALLRCVKCELAVALPERLIPAGVLGEQVWARSSIAHLDFVKSHVKWDMTSHDSNWKEQFLKGVQEDSEGSISVKPTHPIVQLQRGPERESSKKETGGVNTASDLTKEWIEKRRKALTSQAFPPYAKEMVKRFVALLGSIENDRSAQAKYLHLTHKWREKSGSFKEMVRQL